MQAKVDQAYIERAKKDLMDFFSAESTDRSHWIFDYARKQSNFERIQWHSGSVFWVHQLEVLFEDKHFHWNIGFALRELVNEGELILMNERSPDVKKELARYPQANVTRITFLFHKSNRYYIRNMKRLLNLLNTWWNIDYFKGIGSHGESASELSIQRLGFNVIDRNTNEYKGKKYTKSDKDLDFIIEKDQIGYGVEVKNTIGYPDDKEFQEKTFELGEELGLIPWWILRNAPFSWNNAIKRLEGFIYRNKAILFPRISKPLADRIWFLTGVPVTLTETLPQKIQDRMRSQHNKNLALFR